MRIQRILSILSKRNEDYDCFKSRRNTFQWHRIKFAKSRLRGKTRSLVYTRRYFDRHLFDLVEVQLAKRDSDDKAACSH